MEDENEVEDMDVLESDEEDVDTAEEPEDAEIAEGSGGVESDGDQPVKRKVYLPGQSLGDNEVLEPDPSAYVMLHEAHAGKLFCYIIYTCNLQMYYQLKTCLRCSLFEFRYYSG